MPLVISDNRDSVQKFPDKETKAVSSIPFCEAKLSQSYKINRHPIQGETNHVFTLGKKDEVPEFVVRVNFCGKESLHYWQNNFIRSANARSILPKELNALCPKVIKVGSMESAFIPFCYIIEEFKKGENATSGLENISRLALLEQLGCLSSQINSIKVAGIGATEVFIQEIFQNKSSLGLDSLKDYMNFFSSRVEDQLSSSLRGKLNDKELARIRHGLDSLKHKGWESVGLCHGDINLSNVLTDGESVSCILDWDYSSGNFKLISDLSGLMPVYLGEFSEIDLLREENKRIRNWRELDAFLSGYFNEEVPYSKFEKSIRPDLETLWLVKVLSRADHHAKIFNISEDKGTILFHRKRLTLCLNTISTIVNGEWIS